MSANDVCIDFVSWQEARVKLAHLNPSLTKIIDEISPGSDLKLILAKYPYGTHIVESGDFSLPTKNGSTALLDSSNLDSKIKEQLDYVKGTNPMSVILENNLELYIPFENRVIPYAVVKPGSVFGTWGVLEHYKNEFLFYTPIPLWNLTSGARSISLLPKVTEANSFYKLKKKYQLKTDKPKDLKDHWEVLAEIYKNQNSVEWNTELLFFTKDWIDRINDPAWHKFKSYIYESAWSGSEFWRNQFCWDITFTRIQHRRGIKPSAFESDIASHLLAMSVGAVPGFKPLTDDLCGPISLFREAFEDVYGIKYAPIIMGPSHFNVFNEKDDPVFYTFNYHTAVRLSPKSSQRSSTLTDLYHIRSLMQKYIDDIKTSDLKIDGTALYEMAKRIDFKYCHYVNDEDLKMDSPNEVLQGDKAFKKALKQCKRQNIPKNSPILNGCIHIGNK